MLKTTDFKEEEILQSLMSLSKLLHYKLWCPINPVSAHMVDFKLLFLT